MHALDRRALARHIYNTAGSLRKAAVLLKVSHTTIRRWLQCPDRKRYDSTRRQARSKAARTTDLIRKLISENPFISCAELCRRVRQDLDVTISASLASTVVRRCGYSHKKARYYGKAVRSAELETAFLHRRDELLRARRTFFSVDETAFGRHGKPTRGYAPKGQPLFVHSNIARLRTQSALACVSSDGQHQWTTRPGSYNTDTFVQAMSSFVLPRGAVVLLDNVSFHHSRQVMNLAVERGWELLFVPPYSPWFNPVEGCFSVVKRAFVRSGSIHGAFGSLRPNLVMAFFQKSMSLAASPAMLQL